MTINNTKPQTINVQTNAKPRIQESPTPSPTTGSQNISESFQEFMSKILTTKIQNDFAYDIAEQLIKVQPCLDITFERAIEEGEIVFVAQNEDAQNILVLDENGDIMVSNTPFNREGWGRKFINSHEVDFEHVVYKFLSL